MRYEWGVADPTILLLSTSDTDLISARASGKNYRWANPSRLPDEELPDLLAGASIVVVRILGGYRAWESGIDTVHRQRRPDGAGQRRAGPRRRVDRTVHPGGRHRRAGSHLPGARRRGQPASAARLPVRHRADDRLRLRAAGGDPDLGRAGAAATPRNTDGPTIAVLYYRAQHLAGNTAYVDALCRAIEDAGGRALPVYCASLRTAEPELLQRLGDADAMVVTVLAAGGLKPADGVGRRR